MTVLSLRFCARAFSSCGKWGPLFIAVRGPLTVAASLGAEHRLQTRRLSNCGSRVAAFIIVLIPSVLLETSTPAIMTFFLLTSHPCGPPFVFQMVDEYN